MKRFEQHRRRMRWQGVAFVTAGAIGAWLSFEPARAWSQPPRAIDGRYTFGMQYVPKFDEQRGLGAWNGTRARGMAFHRDLGVQVSREGFIWRHLEPSAAGVRPHLADFDDVIDRLADANIAVQAMVTETPLWASTAPKASARDPVSFKSAPPKGLNEPIFTDGTDVPGPNKRVNPANTWATLMASLTSRYRGHVRYWQLWNEPDYPSGDLAADFGDRRRSWNGSVDDYVRLLQVGATIVRWIDPNAKVVTGGIGYEGYLKAMLERGAGRYFDQLDFHAYGWPGSDTALAKYVEVAGALRNTLARYGAGDKGLICSETGYTALQPEEQASYIAKLYPTSLALGIESTIYYANVNPSWKTMGLIDWRTMSQKTLGYWAYKNAASALSGVRQLFPLGVANAEGYRFVREDGSHLIVLWAPKRGADAPLAVRVPLGAGRYRLFDMVGRPLGSAAGEATLSLTSRPIYLEGSAARSYTPVRPNAALVRPGLALERAFADSVHEDQGPPEAAIDTDPDSHWANGGFKRPEAWLALGLKQAEAVSALSLKTGPTPEGTWFDVEVSEDGERYVPVARSQRLKSWQLESLRFSEPVRARYVRLHWYNPERKAVNFNVFEIQVH